MALATIPMHSEMAKLIARSRQNMTYATELSKAGQSRRGQLRDGRPVLVSPCTEHMGEWRITYFDREVQPTAHTNYNNAFDAFYDAVCHGYLKVEK